MYAVGFINGGKLGMLPNYGNDGLQKLHKKSPLGWKMELEHFMRVNDSVILIQDFTQDLCETEPGLLYEKCLKRAFAIFK